MAFELLQEKDFTLNPHCGPERFSEGLFSFAAPKKTAFPMLPLYAAPTSRLQDCSHALVPALS